MGNEPSPHLLRAVASLLLNTIALDPNRWTAEKRPYVKLEDMLEANRIVLEQLEAKRRGPQPDGNRIEGRVEIGEGAEIVDSLIRGPVVIGAGARIEHAFVGPYTSIGDGCVLERCEIENSIVLAGSEIRRISTRIDGSLIGRNAQIKQTDLKPKAYRFMLGDNSAVEMP